MIEVRCLTCDRVGKVKQGFATLGGHEFSAIVGLAPGECEGCRKAIKEAGFSIGAIGPAGTFDEIMATRDDSP